MPEWLDWVIKGGNMGLLTACGLLLWKVKGRLDRDDNLLREYPPHRHINGSRILYPKEYQPVPIEHLSGGD